VTVNNNDGRRRAHRWLKEDDRNEVRRLLKEGARPEELAVKYEVHFNTIRNIAREKPTEAHHEPKAKGDGQ
jgi:hypothetical protein